MIDVSSVRTLVGIDAHGEHCTVKAISCEGKDLLACDVPTESKALRAAVKGLPHPVWVVVEAGAMAPFVTWALEGAVERVIACETRENRWIAKSEDKGDPRDADRLARLLRMGEVTEVYVPRRERQELRDLVRLYGKTVQDGTRLKNRLKAVFRRQGVLVSGGQVFTAEGRTGYLKRVTRSTVRVLLEVLYEELDAVDAAADRLARRLTGMLGHRREYRRLLPIPGIGPVAAAILVAVIDDPHRFRTTRKLWKYAGLSVKAPWSGRPEEAKRTGSTTGHRLLKYAALSAARHALQGDNRFARHHAAMVKRGLAPAMADRTIARSLLATVLTVWKEGTEYRESWPA